MLIIGPKKWKSVTRTTSVIMAITDYSVWIVSMFSTTATAAATFTTTNASTG